MMDYKNLFYQMPNCYLIVAIDAPKFTMLDVSEKHASSLRLKREDLIGKGLFDVFPDNPLTSYKNSEDLRRSFMYVIMNNAPHNMDMMRYDVHAENGAFETRYWKVSNYPFFEDGKLIAIINYAIDATNAFTGFKL